VRDVNPERVLDAALELVDAQGLGALSMRKLASELGVQAPSLYHHVSGKAELLAALVERVGAGADASWFGERSWDEALLRWGRTYHAALAAHPALAPLFVHSSTRCTAAW